MNFRTNGIEQGGIKQGVHQPNVYEKNKDTDPIKLSLKINEIRSNLLGEALDTFDGKLNQIDKEYQEAAGRKIDAQELTVLNVTYRESIEKLISETE